MGAVSTRRFLDLGEKMVRTKRVLLGALVALSTIFPILGNTQTTRHGRDTVAVFVMTNSSEKNEVISFTPASTASYIGTALFSRAGEAVAVLPIPWNPKAPWFSA